ncbi:MAG: hypothetical protein ACYTEL_26550 [Planctomycetota bacterium]
MAQQGIGVRQSYEAATRIVEYALLGANGPCDPDWTQGLFSGAPAKDLKERSVKWS